MTRRVVIGSVVAAILLALLIAAPALLQSSYLLAIMTVALIYAIWVVSWDFMSGLTGRANFGHGMFLGLSAYAAGYLSANYGTAPWVSFPVGVGISVLLAMLVGLPTLRLRGPYFALATFCASIIVQRLILNLWEYTGAEEGISDIAALTRSPVSFYYVALAVAVISCAVLTVLARTRMGLILRAIRGDEAASLAAGIDITFYKMLSLIISAAVAAVGGTLYAHFQQHVSPDLFSMQLSLGLITMAYVGGIGSIYGGAIAAILLTFLAELLRPFGEWRLVMNSIILVLVLFLFPHGMVQPVWASVLDALQRLSTPGARGAASKRGSTA